MGPKLGNRRGIEDLQLLPEGHFPAVGRVIVELHPQNQKRKHKRKDDLQHKQC